eukprot:435463-Prorocentrum_minimum.AAC.1
MRTCDLALVRAPHRPLDQRHNTERLTFAVLGGWRAACAFRSPKQAIHILEEANKNGPIGPEGQPAGPKPFRKNAPPDPPVELASLRGELASLAEELTKHPVYPVHETRFPQEHVAPSPELSLRVKLRKAKAAAAGTEQQV